ncbi:MAG TPA: cyclic nucleotide-binding domain-containing protein [Actinomycetota bacterium]
MDTITAPTTNGESVRSSETAELLGKVPIFSELSRKDLERIAGAAKEVTHRSGSTLAREGESGVGFFLIVNGTANVDVGGTRRKQLSAGDFFGEISLLDGGPRTATVVAESDVTTIGLTQWDFKSFIEQNPSIASKMLKVMATRLRASSQDVTH